MRVAAIGDNCIDVYTNLGQSFPGGGAVNFAVHAHRAGLASAYVGAIGDDEHGRLLKAALGAEGVDGAYLIEVPGPTAVAYVRLEQGERTFIGSDHGVRGQLAISTAIDVYLAGFDLLHATLDSGVDAAIPGWAARGQRLSYDFSHRARPAQLALIPALSVAFFSGQATPPAAVEDVLVAFGRQTDGCVVMTLGERGSLAYWRGRIWRQPALPTEVVDTLGAGDAFQAGFMAAHLQGGSIEEALAAGAQQAASVCTHLGGFGHGRAGAPALQGN